MKIRMELSTPSNQLDSITWGRIGTTLYLVCQYVSIASFLRTDQKAHDEPRLHAPTHTTFSFQSTRIKGNPVVSPLKLSGTPSPPGKKPPSSPSCGGNSAWIMSCNAPILKFPRPTVASPWVEWDPRIPPRAVFDNPVIGAAAAADSPWRRGMPPPPPLLLPLSGAVAVAHDRSCPVLAVAALPGIGDEALGVCRDFDWRQDGTASSQSGFIHVPLARVLPTYAEAGG